MSSLFKLIILLIGLSFSGTVLFLLVKKKINERNTLIWLGGSAFILIFSLNPKLLDQLVAWTGVDYPPSLLFLFSLLALLVLALYHSIQISVLQEKIQELSQHIALRDIQDRMQNQGKGSVIKNHDAK